MTADGQIATDLLARQMWITFEMARGNDGIDAAMLWDRDELLTDTYERWETVAADAIRIETQNRTEGAS